MHRQLILITGLVLLLASLAQAGWTEDIRLTSRGHEIHPQVIARNDTVHVAWEQIAGDMHLSYMRSSDGGYEWEALQNIEDAGHWAGKFSFSQDGHRLMLGWMDEDTNPPNHVGNIALAILEEGQWSSPVYVYDTFHGLEFQEVATEIDGDTVYVVYLPFDSDSTGYRPFIFLYSTDLGQTWSDEETIAHCGAFNNNLRMAKCYSTIYVFWAGDPIPIVGHPEISGVVSHDGGQSWSEEIQLSSEDHHSSQLTCMACCEITAAMAVGWMEAGYPGDFYLRITTDGGYSWGGLLHATNHHLVSRPALAIAGDTIWAVWSDHDPAYGAGNWELAFTKSTDGGSNWSPYERLTFAEGESNAPWISYDGGKLHLVWWDSGRPSHSGDEIYYKRWEPTVSVEEDSPVPSKLMLKAYPNPFNSSLEIMIQSPEEGVLTVYDVLGKLIRQFQYEAGSSNIRWDATDALGNKVSSGIYFARARGTRRYSTIKLIYLR